MVPAAKALFQRAGRHVAALILMGACCSSLQADPVELVVQTKQPGPRVSPTMHGVFFEDINYAADGGLYAELVENRSFEHRNRLYAWETVGDEGSVSAEVIDDRGLHENNPHYCRLQISKSDGDAGIRNDGYDGYSFVEGATYYASLHARGQKPGGTVHCVLRDSAGAEVARAQLGPLTGEWQHFEQQLTVPRSVKGASLEIVFEQPGTYDVDMVSLFPADTFHGHRNGLRKDLAEKIQAMKPGFVRFPGGCIVEGRTLDNAYRWKDTVGPIWQRKQNFNRWTNRESPQYFQTYGLGFFEFFQFCEDIGAEAVPILNCGMACQFQSGELCPLDDLDEWIQDALDLVEFANGPASSNWGKLRAEMGHPEPFNIKYLGIGNEQWMEGYFDRYVLFEEALSRAYPDLQIISTSGPSSDGRYFDYAWDRFRSGVNADLIDEHYYRPPQWFLENTQRYDRYDRRGPKVFAGEFAAHDVGRRATLRAAITEAAYMTGLWRNADVVTMSSYAPLFARAGHAQWAPDLIWFDNDRSYGTASYHVQAMYGQNVPDVVLPVEFEQVLIPPPEFAGRVGIGTWLTRAEFKDVKVTRGDEVLYEAGDDLSDWELFGGDWSAEQGVFRQSSNDQNVRAFVGDPAWQDYTITLKARKLGGAEGFLVSFASKDPRTTSWWNLGGWSNTLHGLESPLIPLRQVRGEIETERWYDVRIKVGRTKVECYLDGKLEQQADLEPTPALFAAAGWDEDTGEYVVAVTNAADRQIEGSIRFADADLNTEHGKAIVLTSESEMDENSFDQPDLVSPREQQVEVETGAIQAVLPAKSFTIFRVAGGS